MNCLDLFHANDEKRCRRFLEEDEYLIMSEEDGVWMGSGMYFWDNRSNAEYWKKRKSLKSPVGQRVCIVKANVSLEKCLDLTDDEVLNYVRGCWKVLQSKTKGLDNNQLGFILNSLFDQSIFGEIAFAEDYEVLKGILSMIEKKTRYFSRKQNLE